MNHLKLETPDLTVRNIDRIAELFPNCITETRGEDGQLKRAVNFDTLRQMLSGDVAEGDEAYEFTWVGKKASIVEANRPIRKTLRPCPEESVDWDTTENLYIEGDNLEVLKLLQESYLGKVKMIYIDPPYNTGHDFIYRDDFRSNADEYDEQIGLYDDEDNKLFKNTDSNGRFHSDWCSMLYPRLLIARNYLASDGVIFISIDDRELAAIKITCDEVFGRKNFLCNFCWRTDGNFDNQAKIKICHQYILMYTKNEDDFSAPPVIDPNIPNNSKLFRDEIRNTIIKNGPKNPVSAVRLPAGFPCDFENGVILSKNVGWPKYNHDISISEWSIEGDVEASSGWASKAQLLEFIRTNFSPVIDTKGQETRFLLTKTGAIEAIKTRSDKQSHVISVLENFGGSQRASSSLSELSGYFDFPKPVELIKYFLQMNYDKNFICLDFFSGSATTAHAVMQLNAEDGGHRKFIMVQLPEKCDEQSEAYKAGYRTICDIGKERIRRAGRKIKDENPLATQDLDIGFRVFKVDSSNMEDVYFTPEHYTQDMLDRMESNIKPDRSDLDLLFGCLLDWGLPLSLPYRSETIDGCMVHTYSPGDAELDIRDSLIACFDPDVPESAVREIARRQPIRAVFRDSGFASSAEKINVGEIFKMLAPETRVKVI